MRCALDAKSSGTLSLPPDAFSGAARTLPDTFTVLASAAVAPAMTANVQRAATTHGLRTRASPIRVLYRPERSRLEGPRAYPPCPARPPPDHPAPREHRPDNARPAARERARPRPPA